MATETTRRQGNGADAAGQQVCDLLVRNAYVLTMDALRTKYPAGAIAIDGRDIVAVGADSEVAPRFRPRRVIDADGAMVHPASSTSITTRRSIWSAG